MCWGEGWKQSHEDKGIPHVGKSLAVTSVCQCCGSHSMSALQQQWYECLTLLVHPPSSLGKCYPYSISADVTCGGLIISLSRWTGRLSLASRGSQHPVVVTRAIVSMLMIIPCSQITTSQIIFSS